MTNKPLTGNKKDKYRMRIQRIFYDFYQGLVLPYRMRFIYLDWFCPEDPNLLKNRLLKEQKDLFLGNCEKLDQERSI